MSKNANILWKVKVLWPKEVTPSLISRNPLERRFSVWILLLIVRFPSHISWVFDIEINLKWFKPHAHMHHVVIERLILIIAITQLFSFSLDDKPLYPKPWQLKEPPYSWENSHPNFWFCICLHYYHIQVCKDLSNPHKLFTSYFFATTMDAFKWIFELSLSTSLCWNGPSFGLAMNLLSFVANKYYHNKYWQSQSTWTFLGRFYLKPIFQARSHAILSSSKFDFIMRSQVW